MNLVRRRLSWLTQFFHLESWARLCLLCVLVGGIAGLAGVLLDRGLFYCTKFVLEPLVFNISPGSLTDLLLLIAIPTIGLAIGGWIAGRWAPEIMGGGSDAVIYAFHQGQGNIRPLVPWLKGICSIFTIGFGGSAGREGPTLQIGAGIGSGLANRFRLSVRDRRILMLSGCAGGLGAILRAPLGGALFAAEMLYREPDFEHDAVIPSVISSVTAYSVLTAILGLDPIFNFKFSSVDAPWPPKYPSPGGNNFGELIHYALLSLICAFVAFLLVKSMRLFRDRIFGKLPLSNSNKPALGGLLLGLFVALTTLTGIMQPEHIMGDGKEFLNVILGDAMAPQDHMQALSHFTLKLLALVILSKIVATGLTIGSGASGGMIFPILFIGAVTGAAYVKFWQAVPLPGWLQLTPGASAGMCMVAMGGLFCGCTKTPIASLVMISEMTGSYGLSVPLMLCCASTYLLTIKFNIDESQVPGMADSPAHRGDFAKNILEDLRVGDALTGRGKPELIPATLNFNLVMERIKNSNATTFPIVDDNQCLVGIFSLSDIRKILNEQQIGSLVVAGDLGTTNVVTVTMDTDLSEALRLFTQRKINVLPVVEVPPPEAHARTVSSRKLIRPRGMVGNLHVIAMLTRQDLIDAYRKRIFDLESVDASESAGSDVFTGAQVAEPEPSIEAVEEIRELTEILTKPIGVVTPDISDPNAKDETMIADIEEEKRNQREPL